MDDYLDDGTEDESTDGALGAADAGDDEASLQPVTIGSVKTGEMSPLELADMYRRSRINKSQAAADLKAKIERARNVILQQPTKQSKADWLLGVGSTLLAPGPVGRAGTLGESLGSLGKYVSDVSAQERKAKALQAQQLANFDLTAARAEASASKEDERALASMMNKYLGQKTAAVRKTPVGLAQDEIDALNTQDPDKKNPRVQSRISELQAYISKQNRIAPERDPADVIKAEMLTNAYAIVNNPKAYSDAQVQSAQTTIDRLTPPDVRKAKKTEEGNERSYQSRLQTIKNVVAPDVKRAIKMIDANPTLAAGVAARAVKDFPFLGQKATDLENILDTIRSSVGFEKLEELKKMSPYGASGLGAVSNAEQRLLQSVKGSLQQDNSAKNLRFNLQRLLSFYEETVPDLLGAAGVSGEAPAATTPDLKSAALQELERRRQGKK